MIAIMKKPIPKELSEDEKKAIGKPCEIIVERTTQTVQENENGRLEIVNKTKSVNITRMVNETKKLIKAETAAEKLAEIQKVFSK